MGYTTEFKGHFRFSTPLTDEQINYLQVFSKTRRMKRDVNKLMEMYNGEFGFNGDYGREGEYFAKDDGNYGQLHDESIIDCDNPPNQLNYKDFKSFEAWQEENEKLIDSAKCTPSLWCKWIPSKTGKFLKWDGREKFYEYIPWLNYLIVHFFEHWDTTLNGTVHWQGENEQDQGMIIIKNNKIILVFKHDDSNENC